MIVFLGFERHHQKQEWTWRALRSFPWTVKRRKNSYLILIIWEEKLLHSSRNDSTVARTWTLQLHQAFPSYWKIYHAVLCAFCSNIMHQCWQVETSTGFTEQSCDFLELYNLHFHSMQTHWYLGQLSEFWPMPLLDHSGFHVLIDLKKINDAPTAPAPCEEKIFLVLYSTPINSQLGTWSTVMNLCWFKAMKRLTSMHQNDELELKTLAYNKLLLSRSPQRQVAG